MAARWPPDMCPLKYLFAGKVLAVWSRVTNGSSALKLTRQRVDGMRNNPDIWVEDLERGTRSP